MGWAKTTACPTLSLIDSASSRASLAVFQERFPTDSAARTHCRSRRTAQTASFEGSVKQSPLA